MAGQIIDSLKWAARAAEYLSSAKLHFMHRCYRVKEQLERPISCNRHPVLVGGPVSLAKIEVQFAAAVEST